MRGWCVCVPEIDHRNVARVFRLSNRKHIRKWRWASSTPAGMIRGYKKSENSSSLAFLGSKPSLCIHALLSVRVANHNYYGTLPQQVGMGRLFRMVQRCSKLQKNQVRSPHEATSVGHMVRTNVENHICWYETITWDFQWVSNWSITICLCIWALKLETWDDHRRPILTDGSSFLQFRLN